MTPLAPIFIAGPTGSGKSAVALAVAERLGAEIVSADAYQIYRDMDILTAAPSAEDRRRIPHHLVDLLTTDTAWDAASHYHAAQPILQGIASRGKRAVIVGGSGLYLKFLSHGISPAPPSDPALRAELENTPLEKLAARLRSLDPEGASATDLQNPRYLIRNLEIVILGGQPLSHWRNNWQPAPFGPGFAIVRETEDLDRRIARRSEAMLAQGAIDEVRSLGSLSPTAEQTLGLKQIRSHLDGAASLEETAAAITLATRQYAKRQRTWLRRETWLTPIHTSSAATPQETAETILNHLRTAS